MTTAVDISAIAIICASRLHGEHGSIVHMLTREDGLVRGYLPGGQSRQLRPVIIPGNIVKVELRSRSIGHMARARIEPHTSYAPLLSEPLPTAALAWVTLVTTISLAENHPYPALFDALSALLKALEAADSAREWAAAIARFELLLLSELGYGLDLTSCAVSGSDDELIFVSPKSGRAVSRAAAQGYESRLLALPHCLHKSGGASDATASLAALDTTGYFVRRFLRESRYWRWRAVLDNRQRLIARLEKAFAVPSEINHEPHNDLARAQESAPM